MRASLALSAVRRGRLEEAERLLDEIGEVPPADMTAGLVTAQVRAELVLVRGDVEGGLAAFDRCLETTPAAGASPTLSTNGLEPWTLIALATDLAAHARYAETPAQSRAGRELAAEIGEPARRSSATVPDAAVDYPVTGMALAALGQLAAQPRRRRPTSSRPSGCSPWPSAFGYNRWFPVMDWEPMAALADDAAPGLLAAVLEEYDGRQGRELRPEAERVLASVLGRALTSSG